MANVAHQNAMDLNVGMTHAEVPAGPVILHTSVRVENAFGRSFAEMGNVNQMQKIQRIVIHAPRTVDVEITGCA